MAEEKRYTVAELRELAKDDEVHNETHNWNYNYCPMCGGVVEFLDFLEKEGHNDSNERAN